MFECNPLLIILTVAALVVVGALLWSSYSKQHFTQYTGDKFHSLRIKPEPLPPQPEPEPQPQQVDHNAPFNESLLPTDAQPFDTSSKYPPISCTLDGKPDPSVIPFTIQGQISV